MIVKSLEQMEQIVSQNKSLKWNGWDVLELIKSDKARTSKDGVYLDKSWYLQKRFKPSRDGWNIPNKYSSDV